MVLCHNQEDIIGETLGALTHYVSSSGRDVEIIVVDNASTDRSLSIIEGVAAAHPSSMQIVANSRNRGAAGGRNCGLLRTTGPIVVTLDDDTVIREDTLDRLLEIEERYPATGVFGFNITHVPMGNQTADDLVDAGMYSTFEEAGAAFRRELLDAIGGQDEECRFGAEGLEYSIRCREAGWDVTFLPEVVVDHYLALRLPEERVGRQIEWVHAFLRVFSKSFSTRRAIVLSWRFMIGHVILAMKRKGPMGSVHVVMAGARGFRDGLRQRERVSRACESFYSNPDLRPEFGNVPLWRKAVRRLRDRPTSNQKAL